ncbi:ABC transporter ATP-binding protein [Kribbella sandramycini]|uniref:ABC transporter ATP-binding protein n=1 Tax=Kribbella sandramycini TaxID=60450 RepID=A0A7Y4L7B0_9ACTN|nr:ABC transporter ATP-binding protein [Kribbella sandramycini]MBB6568875.1 oligopeptide/dipeptide ABC transporter ATP-binding protein [Kribbella sandramycini]NOL45643.1 ABC transporter ATP-binding protein [Kribbella sandramycini]
MTEELLRLDGVRKYFGLRGVPWQAAQAVRAVDGVSFVVRKGETVGLVGESGSGKSTLARVATRLLDPTAGRVEIGGKDVTRVRGRRLRPVRRRVQMVFQDPQASLNPRQSVGTILSTPFRAQGTRPTRTQLVELLHQVGLSEEHLERYPHEFSGGQRQRIGIARALAVSPDLLICDEPVSALDVSVQAQVLNLLADLRDELGLSYVVVAHDLAVVRQVAGRVAVMYLGTIVEEGPSDQVYNAPAHPYTKALLSAVPVPEPGAVRERIVLTGDVPTPIAPPSGCPFRTRCYRAEDVCATERPVLQPVAGQTEHLAACYFPEPPTSERT